MLQHEKILTISISESYLCYRRYVAAKKVAIRYGINQDLKLLQKPNYCCNSCIRNTPIQRHSAICKASDSADNVKHPVSTKLYVTTDAMRLISYCQCVTRQTVLTAVF